MLRSNSDPDLLVFNPEIERSLKHIRQVKRRIQFENTQYSQIKEVFSETDSTYSSAFETDIELPSSDSGTSAMGDLPRITLKQMGGASMALENQPVQFPELNENFELKSGLQEDNTVAASHNFYENQQSPPNNRQYYTQPQAQNSQNPRYQPPHARQTYPPPNAPPLNYEETLQAYQQDSREMKETQKRFESQLSHITELLHKFTNQPTINPHSQPSTSSPLPSQPLPNPKGGINMVHNEMVQKEEEEDEEEEGEDDWLYELLAELASSDESEDKEEIEEEIEEEVVEK
ncbi:hypothetical protein PIB30_072761 [Stylosanthes scabra]|uniref:Uncharacterized protein n=1 Tax=Stylosanthes scabra TaxID=79078 RepID=A0ABU6TNV2_9FABA|nr:hypothetical protein [Stylosanthes scabra]